MPPSLPEAHLLVSVFELLENLKRKQSGKQRRKQRTRQRDSGYKQLESFVESLKTLQLKHEYKKQQRKSVETLKNI